VNTNDTSSNLAVSYADYLAMVNRHLTSIILALAPAQVGVLQTLKSSRFAQSTTPGTPDYMALGVKHLSEDTGSPS